MSAAVLRAGKRNRGCFCKFIDFENEHSRSRTITVKSEFLFFQRGIERRPLRPAGIHRPSSARTAPASDRNVTARSKAGNAPASAGRDSVRTSARSTTRTPEAWPGAHPSSRHGRTPDQQRVGPDTPVKRVNEFGDHCVGDTGAFGYLIDQRCPPVRFSRHLFVAILFRLGGGEGGPAMCPDPAGGMSSRIPIRIGNRAETAAVADHGRRQAASYRPDRDARSA